MDQFKEFWANLEFGEKIAILFFIPLVVAFWVATIKFCFWLVF